MSDLPVSRLLIESVLQSTHDAIVIADADHRILAWNKGAERIFGYTDGDISGHPIELLMAEPHRDLYRRDLDRFRLSGKSIFVGATTETEGLRRDGTNFPLELSLASWCTPESAYFTAVLSDLSDERRRAHLRNFVTEMRHELRTPLTAIIGCLQILLKNENGRLHSEEIEFLRRIMVNASDQLQLINSLLDLAGIESRRREGAFDPNLDVLRKPA